MLDLILRALPLATFAPLRRAAVALPRGNPLRSASIAVLKLAAASRRGKLHREIAEVRPIDMPQYVFAPTNSMVIDAVFWVGVTGYEGRLSDIWIQLCRQASSVLEIGGNIGLFTVIGGAVTRGQYTVVEPVPQVARVLATNLAMNGLADRIELVQAAVVPATVARDVVLNIPAEGRDAPVGAHLVDGVEIIGRSTETMLTVHGVPFAELLEDRDLVKIDAEGIEAELLAAAHDTLVANGPTLCVEVLPEADRLGKRIAVLARDAGYFIHVVPAFGAQNIIVVPPDAFNSSVPGKHRSKDVVLCRRRLD